VLADGEQIFHHVPAAGAVLPPRARRTSPHAEPAAGLRRVKQHRTSGPTPLRHVAAAPLFGSAISRDKSQDAGLRVPPSDAA